MSIKNTIKKRFYCLILGIFLMLMGTAAPVTTLSAYAEPNEAVRTTIDEEGPIHRAEIPSIEENPAEETPVEGENAENTENTEAAQPAPEVQSLEIIEDQGPSCSDQLSPVGWLICPIMEVTAKAVDSLYGVIEDLLVIQPISTTDGAPIYTVWKHCLGLTNIVFIIFFLVVIYSQITGVGITNYGIKKVLPKLIIAAVLVNLSFHLCAIVVDVSNIIGASLRGFFDSIPAQLGNVTVATGDVTFSEIAGAVLGGASIGLVAFEAGALFMLIPAILGGLVAIVSGLITIAIRQAVVILLVMISPLALVCYMLPNTENLFKKWKNLFTKMLVFYPMFSLLFGASSLAGWAIIASALNKGSMFMVILGLAVQVFPLFACWSLMKLSGTFLSNINNAVRGLAAKPLAANRAWAESRKQNSYAKHLASSRSYLPSRYLMKYLSDRKIARDLQTKDYNETISARGGAYYARSMYSKNGKVLNRKGAQAYERVNRRMGYQLDSLRHTNNFEAGIGGLGTSRTTKRYNRLDDEAILASDALAMETSRGELIAYDNARSRHERFNNAIKTHVNARNSGDSAYRKEKLDGTYDTETLAAARYAQMRKIMGDQKDEAYATQYIASDAASTLAAQHNIVKGKLERYFDMVPPTNYVTKRIEELAQSPDSSRNIEAIIGGMRIFNNRGDTSLIEKTINELCANGKLKLGTHASQALAGFLMFEVKDRDSTLRRFGKYINLETAKIYNDADVNADGIVDEGKRRHKLTVDLNEYVNGEYVDQYVDKDGKVHIDPHKKSKKGMEQLLLGTSFSGAEREAFAVLEDTIRQACIVNPDAEKYDQKVDVEKFVEKSTKVFNSILPNIVGDQFSYLSGSEQITALAKFITKNPLADYQLSDDTSLKAKQEKMLADFQKERVDSFIRAQVYSQISRAKSDIFVEVKDYYDNLAALELGIYDEAFKDTPRTDEDMNLSEEEWREKTIDNEDWRKSVRNGKNPAYEKYQKKIREVSSKLFKDNLQKGVEDSLFLNARRGNLPDAKTGLTEYLDLNNIAKQTEVYNRTHPKKGKNSQDNSRDDEDEEDAPTDYEDYEPHITNVEVEALAGSIEQLRRGNVGVQDTMENRQNCYGRLTQMVDSCTGISSDERYRITHEIDPNVQSIPQMIDSVMDNLKD